MRGIFGWLGAFIVGSLGGWLGTRIGPGIAFMIGCVGGGVGLYYGRKLFDGWLG
ncbi:MAG TPA: hypothetical protein VFK24_05310 [Gammaproteobacteria bacterium]|nr:hypothetical protein [Gammaproteobacteria bacterium]